MGCWATDGLRYGLPPLPIATRIVLIFSSNRCPTAKAYGERMNALQREYGPRGVQLLRSTANDPHLYPDESYPRMVERAAEDGYTFPYLVDDGQQVAKAYGATCTFHVFVLDRERRLRYEGRFDDSRSRNVSPATTFRRARRRACRPGRPRLGDATVRLQPRLRLSRRTGIVAALATPKQVSLYLKVSTVRRRNRALPIVGVAIVGGAWLTAGLAQLSGNAGLLHHHALIEDGPPLWVALTIFLVAWQVMIAAMMLPASLPAITGFARASASLGRPRLGLVVFLAAFAGVWTIFGLAAFMGDVGLHTLVDRTPFLAARPWLIEASVLILAGVYQFMPLKRRGLAACRHPAIGLAAGSPIEQTAWRLGFRHALDCVASSWALMLLMFAAGFANLGWMAALAALMVYETMGRHGRRAAMAAGASLIALAGVVIMTGWMPGFGAT